MAYTVSGTLKLPDGTAAAGVDLRFVALTTYSPLIESAEQTVRTGTNGSYSIALETSSYNVFVTYNNNRPFLAGRIVINSNTAPGQDLPTLLGGTYQPATPDWIQQVEAWLAQAQGSAVAAEGFANSAKTEANRAKTEADRSKSEADRAKQISGLETVSDAVALTALPMPDVWAPLSDSLRLITGYGRDVLVGSDVVARMVNFSRNSTATYIGKDGQLKTAAANEPRFEKEGLLLEGQSTNLVPWSRGADYSKNPSYFLSNASAVTNGDALVVTVTATNGGVGGVLSGTHEGKTTTVSLWAKGAVGGERLRVGLSTDQGAMPFDIVLTTNWARYSKTYSIGASDTQQTSIRIYAQSPCTFSIDKVQCEELPFATSYVPTNGAASTRAADQVWLPAAGNRFIGGLYAVAFEFDLLGRVTGAGFSRLLDFDNSGGTDRQHISLTEGGQLQCVMGTSQTIASVTGKLAGRAAMRMNNFALNVMMDGVAGSSVTASGVGVSLNNRIVLMNSNQFNLPSYGHIRNLRMWSKHPISNDQLRTAA